MTVGHGVTTAVGDITWFDIDTIVTAFGSNLESGRQVAAKIPVGSAIAIIRRHGTRAGGAHGTDDGSDEAAMPRLILG